MIRKILPILLLVGTAAFLSGCAGFGSLGAEPWEKEYLADPIMAFDSDREEKAVKEHFLATREGSAGSFGVSGGGCGCN